MSSESLAELTGVNAAKVRKDLSHLGTFGTRGVGYDVRQLLHRISQILGLTKDWEVVIVGFGNLGAALSGYRGFAERGFRVAAVVDNDPGKVGRKAGPVKVTHLDELPELVATSDIKIGIIATPARAAQEVADRLVGAGVRSILNFAPAVINVPEAVWVRKVDLSTELQILSFHLQAVEDPSGRVS